MRICPSIVRPWSLCEQQQQASGGPSAKDTHTRCLILDRIQRVESSRVEWRIHSITQYAFVYGTELFAAVGHARVGGHGGGEFLEGCLVHIGRSLVSRRSRTFGRGEFGIGDIGHGGLPGTRRTQ